MLSKWFEMGYHGSGDVQDDEEFQKFIRERDDDPDSEPDHDVRHGNDNGLGMGDVDVCNGDEVVQYQEEDDDDDDEDDLFDLGGGSGGGQSAGQSNKGKVGGVNNVDGDGHDDGLLFSFGPSGALTAYGGSTTIEGSKQQQTRGKQQQAQRQVGVKRKRVAMRSNTKAFNGVDVASKEYQSERSVPTNHSLVRGLPPLFGHTVNAIRVRNSGANNTNITTQKSPSAVLLTVGGVDIKTHKLSPAVYVLEESPVSEQAESSAGSWRGIRGVEAHLNISALAAAEQRKRERLIRQQRRHQQLQQQQPQRGEEMTTSTAEGTVSQEDTANVAQPTQSQASTAIATPPPEVQNEATQPPSTAADTSPGESTTQEEPCVLAPTSLVANQGGFYGYVPRPRVGHCAVAISECRYTAAHSHHANHTASLDDHDHQRTTQTAGKAAKLIIDDNEDGLFAEQRTKFDQSGAERLRAHQVGEGKPDEVPDTLIMLGGCSPSTAHITDNICSCRGEVFADAWAGQVNKLPPTTRTTNNDRNTGAVGDDFLIPAISWKRLDVYNAPTARYMSTLVEWSRKNKLLMFGGTRDGVRQADAGELYTVTVEMNEKSLEFHELKTVGVRPESRWGHTATMLSSGENPENGSEMLVIAGGVAEGQRYLDSTHILDCATLVWRELYNPCSVNVPPRAFHMACAIPHNASRRHGASSAAALSAAADTTAHTAEDFVILGGEAHNTPVDHMWQCQPDSNKWTALNTPMVETPEAQATVAASFSDYKQLALSHFGTGSNSGSRVQGFSTNAEPFPRRSTNPSAANSPHSTTSSAVPGVGDGGGFPRFPSANDTGRKPPAPEMLDARGERDDALLTDRRSLAAVHGKMATLVELPIGFETSSNGGCNAPKWLLIGGTRGTMSCPVTRLHLVPSLKQQLALLVVRHGLLADKMPSNASRQRSSAASLAERAEASKEQHHPPPLSDQAFRVGEHLTRLYSSMREQQQHGAVAGESSHHHHGQQQLAAAPLRPPLPPHGGARTNPKGSNPQSLPSSASRVNMKEAAPLRRKPQTGDQYGNSDTF